MTAETYFDLPAGTICHRNGIPFELAQDTTIKTHEANWPLIKEEFKPSCGEGKEPQS